MWYSTPQIINHLKEKIKKGKLEESIKILLDSMMNNNNYYNEILLLSSRYHEVKKRELSGFGWEDQNKNILTDQFIYILHKLQEEFPSKIELKKTSYLNKHFQPVSPPVGIKRENTDSVFPVQKKRNQKDEKKIPVAFAFVLIVILVFGFNWVQNKFIKKDLNANSIEEDYSRFGEENWGIFLEEYRALELAKKQQKNYKNRNIGILKINGAKDRYWIVIYPFNSRSEAEKKYTETIKKTWPNSKLMELTDYCQNIIPGKKYSFFECD